MNITDERPFFNIRLSDDETCIANRARRVVITLNHLLAQEFERAPVCGHVRDIVHAKAELGVIVNDGIGFGVSAVLVMP